MNIKEFKEAVKLIPEEWDNYDVDEMTYTRLCKSLCFFHKNHEPISIVDGIVTKLTISTDMCDNDLLYARGRCFSFSEHSNISKEVFDDYKKDV